MTEITRDSKASSASFTIVEQNIYGLPFSRGLAKRADTFIGQIEDRFAADFVAVGEAFTHKSRSRLRQVDTLPYASFPQKKRCRPLASGLGALSKHPLIDEHFVAFKGGKNVDVFANKGFLFTRIRHPILGEMDIYTTHLQAAYDSPEQYDEVRDSQIRQLRQFIETMSVGRTVILSGDFNILENHDAYSTLTHPDQMGFIDVMREMHPGAELDTWDPANPLVSDRQDGMRLDYIFLRPGDGWTWDRQKSTSALTMPCDEPILGEPCLDTPLVSDHYGLIATLELARMSE